jgi:metal-responsive CopG/Arc/MetJ family transcriptional regulator
MGNVRFSTSVPEEVYDEFKSVASKRLTTGNKYFAEAISEAMKDYIKKHK